MCANYVARAANRKKSFNLCVFNGRRSCTSEAANEFRAGSARMDKTDDFLDARDDGCVVLTIQEAPCA